MKTPVRFSRREVLATGAAAVGAIGLTLSGTANAPLIRAQSQNAGAVEFEVASIKAAKPGTGVPPSIETSPSTVTMRSKNLIGLLMWAYEIREANQISGPGWILTDDFDIIGKAPAAVSTDQLRIMLQNLLQQRFRMTIRREQKVVPLYSLVADKNGLKIHEVQEEPRAGVKIGMANGIVTCQMVNHISELTAILPQFLEGRPVQDKTGLAGVYEFALNVEMDADQMKRMPQSGIAFTGFGYTSGIFDAVQKLGLKLEATKGPVDFLVIDHVEHPSEN
jgi:uncharacterized protein (TIGR03435 family)